MAQSACSLTPHCKRLYRRAHRDYERKRLDESYASFVQLHAACPSTQTEWALALVASQLADHVFAIRWVTEALLNPVCPFDESERSHAKELQSELFEQVGRCLVLPLNAQVQVDGGLATRERDGTILMQRGRHEVHVHAPGHLPQQREFAIQGGERDHIALERVPVIPLPIDPPDSASARPTSDADDGTHSVAWLSTGSAAGLGALAAVLYGLAVDADANIACKPNCIPDTGEAQSRDDLALAGHVTLGLALTAATTAVILFVLPPDTPEAGEDLQVGIGHVRVKF